MCVVGTTYLQLLQYRFTAFPNCGSGHSLLSTDVVNLDYPKPFVFENVRCWPCRNANHSIALFCPSSFVSFLKKEKSKTNPVPFLSFFRFLDYVAVFRPSIKHLRDVLLQHWDTCSSYLSRKRHPSSAFMAKLLERQLFYAPFPLCDSFVLKLINTALRIMFSAPCTTLDANFFVVT